MASSVFAVRRPGSSGREFHFAGTLRRGAEENRLAVVVLRSGRDIDREIVVEARGSLHHYGSASGCWLVSTGRVHPAAREEAAAEGAAPCALFGGSDLAHAMERLGIGVRVHYIALSDIDFDLLESLGDTGEPRRDRGPREAYAGRERRPQREEYDRDRRGRPQGRDQRGRDEAEREEEGEEAETTEHGRFDLLDPQAAEASRLVPHARDWSGHGDEGEPDTAELEEDEDERRSTLRATREDEPSAEREQGEAERESADAELDAELDADEALGGGEDLRGVDLDALDDEDDGDEAALDEDEQDEHDDEA